MKMKGLTKEQEEERLELYNQGLTDGEISKIVGVESVTIYSWRQARKLKSNHPVNLSETEEQKRIKLYLLGKSDSELATICQRSRGTIASWRRRRGLKANIKAGTFRPPTKEEKHIILYNWNKKSKDEICEMLGWTRCKLLYWREKFQLSRKCNLATLQKSNEAENKIIKFLEENGKCIQRNSLKKAIYIAPHIMSRLLRANIIYQITFESTNPIFKKEFYKKTFVSTSRTELIRVTARALKKVNSSGLKRSQTIFLRKHFSPAEIIAIQNILGYEIYNGLHFNHKIKIKGKNND